MLWSGLFPKGSQGNSLLSQKLWEQTHRATLDWMLGDRLCPHWQDTGLKLLPQQFQGGFRPSWAPIYTWNLSWISEHQRSPFTMLSFVFSTWNSNFSGILRRQRSDSFWSNLLRMCFVTAVVFNFKSLSSANKGSNWGYPHFADISVKMQQWTGGQHQLQKRPLVRDAPHPTQGKRDKCI